MKFFPRDWRGDQGLRACSLAARGLWIEMMVIMHEADPYGHLVLNGQSITVDTLAQMVGAPSPDVATLLEELKLKGVFSIDRNEQVFSRRMKRDRARSEVGKKSVEKRWKGSQHNVTHSDLPNRAPNSIPKSSHARARPEAREDKERKENGKDRSGAKPVERSPSDPVLARATDTLHEYSDQELAALQLTFDTIDVSSELENLVVWADGKGIIKPNERKSAIYAALKRKHEERTQSGSLVAQRENPPSIVVSSAVANSRLAKAAR